MASKKFILPTEDNIGRDKFQDYRKFKTKRLIRMKFLPGEYKEIKKALDIYLEKIIYSNSFKIIADEHGVPNLLLLGFPKVIVSIGSIGNSTKLWEFFLRPQTVENVEPYMYEVGEIDFPVMKIYSGFYCEVKDEMNHYALLNEEEFYYIKWGNVILREDLIDEFIFGTPQMKQIWKDALINAQNEYMRLKNGGALTTTIEVSQDQIWNEPSCSSSTLETRSVSTQQEVNQSGINKLRNQKTLSDEQVYQIIRMLIKDLKAKKSIRDGNVSTTSSSTNNLKRTLESNLVPVVKKAKISAHKVETKSNKVSDERKNLTTKQITSKNKSDTSYTKKIVKHKSQNYKAIVKSSKSERKFEKKQNSAFTSSKTWTKQPLKSVSISNDKMKMKDKSLHFKDNSKSNKVEPKRTNEKDKTETKTNKIAEINIQINQSDEQKLKMQSQGKTIKVVCEIEIGESSKTLISHSVVSSSVTTSESKLDGNSQNQTESETSTKERSLDNITLSIESQPKQNDNTNNECSEIGTEPQTDPKPNDKPSTSYNNQTSNSESSSESSADETEPIDPPNQNIVDPKPNEESDKLPNNSTSNSTELSKNNLKVKTPNLLLRIPKSDAPNEWYSRYIRDTLPHKDSVSNSLTKTRKVKSKSTNKNVSGASTKRLTSIEKYIESRKLFPSNSKLASVSTSKRSSSDSKSPSKTKSNKQTDKVTTTIQRSQSKPTNKDNKQKEISKMKSFNLKHAKALRKDQSNLFRPNILKPNIIIGPSESKKDNTKVTQITSSNSINPQSSSKTSTSLAPSLNIPTPQSNLQTKQNPLVHLAQNGRDFLMKELSKHRALVLTMVHYADYEHNCFNGKKQYHLHTVVHYVDNDDADKNGDDEEEASQVTTRTLSVSLVENIDSNTILGEFVRVITQFKLTQKYLLVAGDETLLNGIPSQCRMSENMIYSMITYLNLYYWRVYPLCEQSILQAVGVELERYKWPYNGIKPFGKEKFRIDYDAELKKYWKSIIANQYDLDFGQSIYHKPQTSINRKEYPNLFKATNFYRSYPHSKDIEQIKRSFIHTCTTVSSLNRNGKLSRDTMSAWSFINMNKVMFESGVFRARFGCVWDKVDTKEFGFEMKDLTGPQCQF